MVQSLSRHELTTPRTSGHYLKAGANKGKSRSKHWKPTTPHCMGGKRRSGKQTWVI